MDEFSTRRGKVGFSVEFADGSVFTERDGTWDDVDRSKAIRSVAVRNLRVGHDYVRLADFASFFFCNEAVCSERTRTPRLVAKVLGGVKTDGTVIEARISVDGDERPTVAQREYPRADLAIAESALRKGA